MFAENRDLNALNASISKSVADLTGAQRCTVLLAEQGTLHCRICNPVGQKDSPVQGCPAYRVIQDEQRLTWVSNEANGHIAMPCRFEADGLSSYIGIPLMADGKLLGVLEAINPTTIELSASDLRLLETLGLAMAVQLMTASQQYRQDETLDMLSSVVEQTADYVIITDKEGSIEYVNPALEEQTGYSKDELLGKTPRILNSGKHTQHFYETLWETILAGDVFRADFINQRKDGQLFYESKTITPVKDAQGNITHFVSTGKDITTLKKAQAAEREQRAFAETLRQAAVALNATLEPEKVLSLMLQQLRQVVPYDSVSVHQLQDDHHIEIVACVGFTDHENVLGLKFPLDPKFPNYRVMNEKTTLNFDDVAKQYPHFTSEASTYSSGRVKSWLGVPLIVKDLAIGMITLDRGEMSPFTAQEVKLATDFANHAAIALENAMLYEKVRSHSDELTKRVAERTAELEAANEHLRALSRVKDEFLTNVSHELRTPISNLKLYHTLLRERPEMADIYMETIQRETDRLQHLIEDLLHISNIEHKRTRISQESVDINELAAEYVTDRPLLAESHGLTLTLSTQPDMPPVLADEARLGQVLSILLTNAFSYTPSGGEVGVSTRSEQIEGKEWVTFSVSDTGPGISPDELEHLFERFFRGSAGRESGAPGIGLGLAIATEIVGQHNGRIEVTNGDKPGQGATFTVWLPAHT